jgi:hypothetical protein
MPATVASASRLVALEPVATLQALAAALFAR